MKFRKKPVVIDAIKWEGGDFECLNAFCGRNWARADTVGSEVWPSNLPDPEQVVVFHTSDQAWLAVPVGFWIIRGIKGELYPCSPEIFAGSYELATEGD